jgi:hypothetical protein
LLGQRGRHNSPLWLAIGLAALLASTPASGIEPVKLSGQLAGLVTDQGGIPQMGATVLLYNRYERLIGRMLTSDRGTFDFSGLPADIYSIRVTLASFLPALKTNISVQPGMRSFLSVNLASLLSTVELVYMAPGRSAVMSEEWKWVLRGAGATRPVLRIIPTIDISDPRPPTQRTGVFSDTRGVLRVSAGEGGSSAGTQADLGTAFALATSLFGSHHLEVSGNVGYASNSGIPTAGFRTSFDPAGEYSPQVNITMRQLFLGTRAGFGLMTGQGAAPALRTMEANLHDRRQISGELNIEYGATLESVTFLRRLNYISPYARAAYELPVGGTLIAGYSSGAPPVNLMSFPGAASEAAMQQQLGTLALFPRVSLVDGAARVQRTQNFELGYQRTFGSTTVSGGAFRESVANAAMTMAGAAGFYSQADLLPDLASRSSIFNIGSYQRMGYTASVSEEITDSLTASFGYMNAGALALSHQPVAGANAAALRSQFRPISRHAFNARVSGVAPVTGTGYIASYQWTDYSVLNPVHFSITNPGGFEPGLNVLVRQPIPAVPGLFSGRLEASAELRNLMAQGYVPVFSSDGRRLLLIHSPRAVRAGLSFIF